MAVLRFEAHDVRRVIANHTEERCFICDDSPSWQQYPEASSEHAEDRRSHNPILREAQLDKDHIKIPWLANHKLEFVFS
ncbi:MAG: hypothetical protein R3C17_12995 [Planctomycetaceae bacterium]